jgi:predicted nucleic acid-binding protein
VTVIALDTSVAIPLLVRSHTSHDDVKRWWARRPVALAGHAAAETYAVLTRLPGDLRVTPQDAARLLRERFSEPLLLDAATQRRLPEILAERDISGGAVYDALVALAAVQHNLPLATRDARAKGTYDALGANVVFAID